MGFHFYRNCKEPDKQEMWSLLRLLEGVGFIWDVKDVRWWVFDSSWALSCKSVSSLFCVLIPALLFSSLKWFGKFIFVRKFNSFHDRWLSYLWCALKMRTISYCPQIVVFYAEWLWASDEWRPGSYVYALFLSFQPMALG